VNGQQAVLSARIPGNRAQSLVIRNGEAKVSGTDVEACASINSSARSTAALMMKHHIVTGKHHLLLDTAVLLG
jgi:hypothetical protein